MSALKFTVVALMTITTLLFVSPVLAEDKPDYDVWEKYSVTVGGFLAALDTNVSLGSGAVGVVINLEDVTGMQSSSGGLRLNLLGRFGATKKHAFNLSYLYFDRNSSRQLLFDQDLGAAGDTISSTFNIQIYKLTYNYSLLMDDRINFSVGLGLYVMPLELSLSNDTDPAAYPLELVDITAPLPTLNFRLEFALTPKLYLRQDIELFYLAYGGFTGSLIDVNIGADYRFNKHFGLGLGLDSFDLKLESNGKDYPEMNFNGEIGFKYTGLMLYGKYYF